MVAAYEFGVMLIKKNYPEYSDKIVYLRDINPKTLGVSDKKIYEMVLSLPLYIKPDELYKQIPEEYHAKVQKITKSYNPPEFYNLRSAILYGICECERSRICSKLLKTGNIEEFASIMNISHDGDRVAITVDGEQKPFDYIYTDERINELIKKCDNNDVSSALYLQGGGYGCSIPQIDALVDSVLKEKGVLSSQISGAGLGGCIMIICKKEYETDILNFLRETYYKPNNLSTDGALLVKPIRGSMCLEY
jgi:N-acetylgalactosamine kinase